MSPTLFLVLAIAAVLSALGMLFSRNAVHSALFLVLNFTLVAVIYLILNAPFIAMVQITVYAGAILVLFLFVIMLLGAEQLRGVRGQSGLWQRVLGAGLTAVLVISFISFLLQGDGPATGVADVIDTSPSALGMRLFEAYIFPFEVTGVLLLAAIIGVVVFSVKKKQG